MAHRNPLKSSGTFLSMMKGLKIGESSTAASKTASVLHTSTRTLATNPMSSQASADVSLDPQASAPNTSPTPYPFSSHARAPAIVPSSFTPPPSTKRITSGVMDYVHHQLRSQFDPNDRLTSLFHRRSPNQIPIGSVLIVESWSSPAKTGMTTFSGVLLGVRRRGTSTSFVLRNLVQKLGVEVRFSLYSPLLKDIRVIARADAGKGNKNFSPGSVRRVRRAKLYYMRRDDNRIAGIGRMIKVRREQDERDKKLTEGSTSDAI